MLVRAATALSLLTLVFAPAPPVFAATQQGVVLSSTTPIHPGTVTLYSAGDQTASGEIVLGTAATDASGTFSIQYTAPSDPNAVLYLIVDGPPSTARLASVLGTAPYPSQITINERTTIATAFAMAQFISGIGIGGKSPGLQNAAGTARNLVNLRTGAVAAMLATAPNGFETSTMAAFNSLANMLAGCIQSSADCATLAAAATPPGGIAPEDTLQAAINIAHYSWHNNSALFLAASIRAPYQPALTTIPETWALAIKYVGNGREFDGPGLIAFDAQGNAWITNNYVYKRNHAVPTCGGETVLKLSPTGQDAPGAPLNAKRAGVNGAGFGIAVDPQGDVWIANFGFFGDTCPPNLLPPANSMSKLSASGALLSPPTGFTQGCINAPQGIVSDRSGNIWITNPCNSTITHYRAGNPNDFWVFDIGSGQLAQPGTCPLFSGGRPFDVSVTATGSAWFSDNGRSLAFELDANGNLLNVSDPQAPITKPLGIAVDQQGNVWISNTGVLNIPCYANGETQDYGDLVPDPQHTSVTKLDSQGHLLANVTGGGITLPWGLAVDGAGNVWVANFAGQRLSHINGATAQPIAPDGYPNDGLVRNTGVTIDSSGNVWLANNWLQDPVQTNPGGDAAVVFIGLAPPVKTPMLGPPQEP